MKSTLRKARQTAEAIPGSTRKSGSGNTPKTAAVLVDWLAGSLEGALAKSAVRAAAVLLIATTPTVWGQFIPHLGYVYPAGGRQGSTFQVVVGGQNLVSATNVYFSGAGIQATVVDFNRPMPQNEFTKLRDELKELQSKRAASFSRPRSGSARARTASSTNTWTAADEKRMAEIRARILKNPPNRQANPAIAETVTLVVRTEPDAEPGEREIRLSAPNGLSNPLHFQIGTLPEFSKPAIKAANPDLDRVLERLGRSPSTTSNRFEMAVSLPAAVNGQIPPGGVDRYRFRARQGQNLVIAVQARDLIPYLADAVPGWFQATLTLYDAKGRELAYDDDYQFHPDPVLHFVVPKDGEYVIEIKDAIYRGREDFVYRMRLGELPFVTSIFPLGGPADASTPVQLRGWNLPTTNITLAGKDKAPGIHPLAWATQDRVLNEVPFAVDSLPECVEQEPNNTTATAHRVTLPCVVNGRVDPPGDSDVFRFDGRAGDEIVAEVWARRLDSPLDSVIKLMDASGRQLAFNDDHEDKGSGLNTHHADSYIRATLPVDGAYFVQLGDAQHHGGPEYGYRLHLRPPQPDFELRLVPSSLSLRSGGSIPLAVYALRNDGFTNEIVLALSEAPDGFKLSGNRIPAGEDQVRLTLTAPFAAARTPVKLAFEGSAFIRGHRVVRPAVPAEDMMQAFAYRHLVPAQELVASVSGRSFGFAAVRIIGPTPVRLAPGGIARIRFAAPTRGFAGRLQLELNQAPEGITLRSVTPTDLGGELVLECDAAKAKLGEKGNLIVAAFASRPPGNQKPKAAVNTQRNVVGTLPAIPFEIVAP